MRATWIAAAALVLACAGRAAADEARALVEAVKKQRTAAEERVVEMEITSKSGRTSKRKLLIRTLVAAGEDRMLVRFQEPRDVARLGLLTVQKAGEADDQHLYLPSQKKAKRIAASDRTGLFAGTDFSYEDLRVEDLDHHDYRLTGEEVIDGEPCHRVEAVPRGGEKEESGYSRRELLISKARPVLRELRLHGKESGQLDKVIRLSDVKDVGGCPRAHRIEVENIRRASKTLAVVSAWSATAKLSAEDLTVFALESGR